MWPQVALTHHAKLSNLIEPYLDNPVNPGILWVLSYFGFLCAEKKLKVRHYHPVKGLTQDHTSVRSSLKPGSNG
jgi:hypothetical protein